MEIAGTAFGVLGLVGLYGTCIEVLDALSAAARYGISRELLQTKIEVERVRLMIWGDAVGLTEIDLDDPSKTEATEDDLAVLDESLQRAASRTAVAGLLSCFVRTFEDAEGLQKRYGLAKQPEPKGKERATTTSSTASTEKPTREMLIATFRKTYSNFKDRAATAQTTASVPSKARWAVVDEPKFRELITELKAINDSLTSLLPAIRNKTRVKMRAEIMQSNDMAQLQNLINAADDVADPISETASLRLEMLSTRGQGIPKQPPPRVVQVTYVSTPAEVQPQTINPRPTSALPRTPSPLPATPASLPQALPVRTTPILSHTLPDPSVDPTPTVPSIPYSDTGSLVIHKVFSKVDTLTCYAWLSGIGEAPELEEVQSAFHPAFANRFMPPSLLNLATSILEVDVEADPGYAGWSPGSTSVSGFAREITFWRQMDHNTETIQPRWRRFSGLPSLTSIFVVDRWKALMKDGLGKDWTARKGYDQVRDLLGPTDYTWLDPEEGFKIRHQIEDLLGAMCISPVPSFEISASIGLIANCEIINPNGNYGFVDFLLQLVMARELSLRIDRDKRRWYGGITPRIVYDMIAADLFGRNMMFKDDGMFQASQQTKEQQLQGILKFAEAMQWPYVDEMRVTVAKLLGPNPDDVTMDLRAFDWVSGLTLPGGFFAMAVVGTLYSLSSTLSKRLPQTTVQVRRGNWGVVYPQASYWSERSILGKVLAPLAEDAENAVKRLGGFIGPCPSPTLPESTFGIAVQLKARSPTSVTNETDVDNEWTRTVVPITDSKQGNTADWDEPIPPPPAQSYIELQTLRLSKVSAAESTEPENAKELTGDSKTPMYVPRLDFRLTKSKAMITMTLHSNSIFVAAPACQGTHRIDPRDRAKFRVRLLEIEDLPHSELDDTPLTVINAAGSQIAHAFARAWCSQRAKNAVVWKREGSRCCFKCALMVASQNGLSTGILLVC